MTLNLSCSCRPSVPNYFFLLASTFLRDGKHRNNAKSEKEPETACFLGHHRKTHSNIPYACHVSGYFKCVCIHCISSAPWSWLCGEGEMRALLSYVDHSEELLAGSSERWPGWKAYRKRNWVDDQKYWFPLQSLIKAALLLHHSTSPLCIRRTMMENGAIVFPPLGRQRQ